jgi:hypothetical protein
VGDTEGDEVTITIRRYTLRYDEPIHLDADDIRERWRFGVGDVDYRYEEVTDLEQFEEDLSRLSKAGVTGNIEVEAEYGELYRYVLYHDFVKMLEGIILWREPDMEDDDDEG